MSPASPRRRVLEQSHPADNDQAMHLRLGISLIALIGFSGPNARASGETTSASPTIWLIEDPAQIGGHLATVLGHPQTLTEPAGKSVHFDGAHDGLLLPLNPLAGWSEFTIEVLFKPDREGPVEQRFLHVQDSLGSRGLLEIRLTKQGWALDTFLYSPKNDSRRTQLDLTKLHESDRWTWVALIYANGHMAHFINGVKELEGSVNFSPMAAGQISLGVRQNRVSWFKGGIREVRLHSRALPGEKLQRTAAD